jgi:hypothetical protein
MKKKIAAKKAIINLKAQISCAKKMPLATLEAALKLRAAKAKKAPVKVKTVVIKKEDLQKKIATDVCKAQPTHPTCKASKPKKSMANNKAKLAKMKKLLKKAVPKSKAEAHPNKVIASANAKLVKMRKALKAVKKVAKKVNAPAPKKMHLCKVQPKHPKCVKKVVKKVKKAPKKPIA